MDSDVVFVTVMAVNIIGSVQRFRIYLFYKTIQKVHFTSMPPRPLAKADIDCNGADTIVYPPISLMVSRCRRTIRQRSRDSKTDQYGGGHEYNVRSGTVNLPAIAAMAKALRLTQKARLVNQRLKDYNLKIRAAVKV